MLLNSCWILLYFMISSGRESISVLIHDVLVPSVIQNGSLPFLVLDCHYTLNHSEKDGMILKWYLNKRTVYQWIPPNRPQGLGSMRHSLNLDFEISPHPYGRHRALYLNSPTTELSGNYTCRISTMQNEASKTKPMVIYEPAKSMSLQIYQRPESSNLNISCLVDHIYPEPLIEIFYEPTTGSQNRERLKGIEERINHYPNGAWHKVIFVLLAKKLLRFEENVFECHVTLPGTQYALQRRTVYKTESGDPTVLASAGSSRLLSQNVLLILLLILSNWKS